MRSPNHILNAGRILRDQLTLSGKNPELLRKLNAIVDLAYVPPADAAKLENLLKQAKE